MVNSNIINEIKGKNKPVIINGAGVVGEIILNICREEGVEIEAFCDSSIKVSQSLFHGHKVYLTSKLHEHYDDATIIISAASIKDVVDLLTETGFDDWYPGGELLQDYDVSQNTFEASIDYTKYAVENCIVCHHGYLNRDYIFVRSIDLIITERCSLRCTNCSNLMQYYENPQNCDTEMLFNSIDLFFKVIDEALDFRIIGGETFMNKDWPLITERLVDEPQTRRVVLYTNSTIIPRKETIPLLQNDKVVVIATDYGPELSRKLPELKETLDNNNIAYHLLEVDEWLDCSKITQHNRPLRDNVELFKLCCAKNMATLSDGKLFRCPYAANAHRLKAVPDYNNDYVDLFSEFEKQEELSAIKTKVRNYLFQIDLLETCDFCNGRPLSGVEVKPAEQVKKPLVYRKYTVKRD